MEIYQNGNQFFGKIIKITEPVKQEALCIKCTGYQNGKNILGMAMIDNLTKEDDDYGDRTILDPANGKVYDCKLWVGKARNLQVRGYIGWYFRTQT